MNVSRLAPFALVSALSVAVTSALGQAPQPPSDLPVVKSAQMPLYPPLARAARIEGTAQLQVWTNGAAIVKVQGSGHKMLTNAAEQNIRTWRFYPHKPTSFTVAFIYGLEKDDVTGFANSSVVL